MDVVTHRTAASFDRAGLADHFVIFGMRANPEPDISVIRFNGHRPIVKSDAGRQESPNFLKVKRGMFGIGFQQRKRFVGDFLDFGRKRPIPRPFHVTLVPFIKSAGELKTKPSQQSIAKLREIGLHPDILLCRTEHALPPDVREKLSTFCNVSMDAVIEGRDIEDTIYRAPLLLQQEKLDEVVCKRLGINAPVADMTDWEQFVTRVVNPKKRVRIAIVGKYLDHKDAYKSIFESLRHAGAALDCEIEIDEVDAEVLEKENPAIHLDGVAGVLVPGGFGERGTEGKIRAAQYARENKVPYLGLCLGMQIATIEFARNVLGLEGANSTEFDKKSPHPVIHLLPGQRELKGKGANMRLGTWPTVIKEGTRAMAAYQVPAIRERHRHRYEFNQDYRAQMEAAGFIIAGTSPEGELVELIELRDHPWYLACQYHPEFQSKPNHPHALFKGFIGAALGHQR